MRINNYGKLSSGNLDDLIKEWYLNRKKSISEIANLTGISRTSIHGRMKFLNIQSRSISEGNHLATGHSFNFTNSIKDYLDGLILGDAGIYSENKFSAWFSQTFSLKYKDWASKISSDLKEYGIENRIQIAINKTILSSLYYDKLLDFRNRWYSNNLKHIPKDINIESKNLLLNFYLGDGSLTEDKKSRKVRIRLCTDSYTFDECYWLLDQLESKLDLTGFVFKSDQKYPRIALNKKGTLEFFNYLNTKCPLESFKHKFLNRKETFQGGGGRKIVLESGPWI